MSPSSTTPPSQAEAESEIRAVLQDWRDALAARDLDRLMQHYADDVRFFDAVPPFEHHGAAAYRATWEAMFGFLPMPLESEVRDLRIAAGGDIAFVSCLQCLRDAGTGEAATCGWVRVTLGLERREGAWKVVHEHVSVPFNPMDGKAAFQREV